MYKYLKVKTQDDGQPVIPFGETKQDGDRASLVETGNGKNAKGDDSKMDATENPSTPVSGEPAPEETAPEETAPEETASRRWIQTNIQNVLREAILSNFKVERGFITQRSEVMSICKVWILKKFQSLPFNVDEVLESRRLGFAISNAFDYQVAIKNGAYRNLKEKKQDQEAKPLPTRSTKRNLREKTKCSYNFPDQDVSSSDEDDWTLPSCLQFFTDKMAAEQPRSNTIAFEQSCSNKMAAKQKAETAKTEIPDKLFTNGFIECDVCALIFQTHSELKEHVKSHANDGFFINIIPRPDINDVGDETKESVAKEESVANCDKVKVEQSVNKPNMERGAMDIFPNGVNESKRFNFKEAHGVKSENE